MLATVNERVYGLLLSLRFRKDSGSLRTGIRCIMFYRIPKLLSVLFTFLHSSLINALHYVDIYTNCIVESVSKRLKRGDGSSFRNLKSHFSLFLL